MRTLTDGGQTAEDVAREVAAYVDGAKSSLDFAHYDFHLGVPVRPIAGVPDLMHHKHVVRDGESVWTGSTRGEDLSHRIGKALGGAKRRIRIASPVITAAPVLSTLAEIVSERRVDVAGCVDQPQVRGVIYQWRQNGNVAWKLPPLERVMQAPFTGKRPTPWEAGSLHDFMHAKITVADDTVVTGSFNLSRSGELNAENVLEIEDSALADRLAVFVDEVRGRYPPFSVEQPATSAPTGRPLLAASCAG